jgi:predicted extracellular nuclease
MSHCRRVAATYAERQSKIRRRAHFARRETSGGPSIVTSTLSISAQRTLVSVLAMALVLGALAPLVAPVRVRAAPTELLFSEYIEGSSNNKALEIFNGTGAAIDLETTDYKIRQYSNGSSTAGLTIELTGTVASADVFVLAHQLAASPILLQADQTTGAGLFNGDDALELVKGETVIDVIGQVGNDPGDEWGSGDASTMDNTLRRKSTVQAGDPVGSDAFVPSVEWDGFPNNNTDGLGSHLGLSGVGTATPASVMVGATTLLTVTVTPGSDPESTDLSVRADLGPIGGPAGQDFFNDGTNGDLIAGDLTFSYLATVGAVDAGSKLITATITDAQARTGTAGISLTVEAAATQIAEIQGQSHLSSFDGQQVFGVEGIVTAFRPGSSGGFWMTDPTPDANANTSDGIFVFRGVAAVGDLVTVNGTVDEFRSGGAAGFENLTITEIVSPTVTIVSGGHDLPTMVIGVDRMPPTIVIDDDSTTSVEADNALYDPENDGIDFWESLEGMRLEVADAVAVGPRACFGATCASKEIAVISQLQADAGVRTPRGGILVRQLGPLGDYRPGDFNPERLILANTLAQLPDVNAGDEFLTDPVGVLDYSFGNFKLFVTVDPGRDDNGLAQEVTGPTGPHDLAVATFNVENLSAIDSDAKVNQLAQQIVGNLRSPDLIAIEEMQDNTGPANNGVVAADLSWLRLISAIVAAGGPLYDYRQIDPEDNADGGAPGGNIRVGFLFHSERGLEFVDRPGGDATTDTDVDPSPNGKGAQLTISPGRVLPDSDGPWATSFELTRKSLAGEFRWRGETLFVVANHFSSKGDDRPLFGHFQPPFRLTEFESEDAAGIEDGWRHAQAQVINDFVDEILAKDGDARFIVLGDINDFDFSETVEVITGERIALDPGPFMPDADGSGQTGPGGAAVMGTLFDQLPANQRYSYVFEGNSQVLDQILVSNSVLALAPRYDVVHVNAEFAAQASDHDPSVMLVAFQPRSGRTSSIARGR